MGRVDCYVANEYIRVKISKKTDYTISTDSCITSDFDIWKIQLLMACYGYSNRFGMINHKHKTGFCVIM